MAHNKYKRLIFIPALICVLLMLSLSSCVNRIPGSPPATAGRETPANLLPNPGFELGQWSANGIASDWWLDVSPGARYLYEWTQNNPHSGKNAVILGNNFYGDVITFNPKQVIDIDPVHHTYYFSLWYRTSDDFSPYGARIVLDYYKNGDFKTNNYFYLEKYTEWTFFETLCEDIPNVQDDGDSYIADGVEINLSVMRCRGWACFDDLDFHIATDEEIQRIRAARHMELPAVVTTAAPVTEAATGTFRLVERTDGTWWFARPDTGICEFMVGMYPRVPGNNPDHEAFVNSHYTSTSFKQHQYDWIKKWNFNSLEAWSDTRLDSFMNYGAGEYMATWAVREIENMGDACKDRYGAAAVTPDGVHRFPDVFGNSWRNSALGAVQDMALNHRNTSQFAGYFIGNEMWQWDLYRYVYSTACGNELVTFMDTRFGSDINALNNAWGTNLSGFADILDVKPVPDSLDDPMLEDFLAFERHMAATLADTCLERLRETDTVHAVAPNRFYLVNFNEALRWMDVFSSYDYIALQIYGTMTRNGFNLSELEFLKTIHEKTGRPAFVSEWAVLGRDLRYLDNCCSFKDNPWVPTQADRGDAYSTVVTQLGLLPWMTGCQWFGWQNWKFSYPDWYKNFGVVNDQEVPYEELTGAMTVSNDIIRRMDPSCRTFSPWPVYSPTSDGPSDTNKPTETPSLLSFCSIQSSALLLTGLFGAAAMGRKSSKRK